MRRASVRRVRAGTSPQRWLLAAVTLVTFGATEARAEPAGEPVPRLVLAVTAPPTPESALRVIVPPSTTARPLPAPAWPWVVGAAAAFAAIVTVSVLVMTRDTATLEGDQELRVR